MIILRSRHFQPSEHSLSDLILQEMVDLRHFGNLILSIDPEQTLNDRDLFSLNAHNDVLFVDRKVFEGFYTLFVLP